MPLYLFLTNIYFRFAIQCYWRIDLTENYLCLLIFQLYTREEHADSIFDDSDTQVYILWAYSYRFNTTIQFFSISILSKYK